MTEDQLRDILPSSDVEYLLDKGLLESTVVSCLGIEIHLVFRNYSLPPEKYSPSSVDLLVKLIPPYPNGNPDMFWTFPQVKLVGGAIPSRADVMQVPAPAGCEEAYNNIPWQRWSRHFGQSGLWRPGVDGLRTYMASIRSELAKGR